jgi:hypothetical protein
LRNLKSASRPHQGVHVTTAVQRFDFASLWQPRFVADLRMQKKLERSFPHVRGTARNARSIPQVSPCRSRPRSNPRTEREYAFGRATTQIRARRWAAADLR